MANDVDRIPPGLWVPMPVPAIKYLVFRGHKSASRILYAIVLHKGKSKTGIFPSYETLNLYSGVGQNNIKACLDLLVKLGFIKITKGREGKKARNYYEILDLAYQLDLNPKNKKPVILKTMICNTCWLDVDPSEFEIEEFSDGKSRDVRYTHRTCQEFGQNRLVEITDGIRINQKIIRSQIEARED